MPVDTKHVNSSIPGIPSRNTRIYTPPDYDRNAAAGYPVIYMHDGQNVFSPGTEFGCWEAENVADEEITSGRIRPFIIAAIDNDGENRCHEYVPPGDQYKQRKPGEAGRYAAFVTNNVIPLVAANYNITDKPSETGIAGASLGGVVSLYMGLTSNSFGMIGSMSTAICWAGNFSRSIPGRSGKPLRIYHDVGSAEPEEMAPDNYDEANRKLHQHLLQAGYTEPSSLKFIIEKGGRHNEAAWCRRLPEMLRWLFGD